MSDRETIALRDALQGIIDWADLALKHKAEFDSHGVKNLTGPAFDKAREALASSTQTEATGQAVKPRWDDKDTDGKPWTYDRADLIWGRLHLGSYSRWADESLRREDADLTRPIHAWLVQASFIDGVYNEKPEGWFATAEEARAFVEAETHKMLAEMGAAAPQPALPAVDASRDVDVALKEVERLLNEACGNYYQLGLDGNTSGLAGKSLDKAITAIRALANPSATLRQEDAGRYQRFADEPKPVLPEGYSAPLKPSWEYSREPTDKAGAAVGGLNAEALADRIIAAVSVHGFENDASAARVLYGQRDGIIRLLNRALPAPPTTATVKIRDGGER